MAASISNIPPAQSCPSCRGWPDHTQDFQKIIDLQNTGLTIYRHTVRIPCSKRGLEDKSVEVTKEIFILQNTKDVKLTASDYVSELEKKVITCPHCLKTVERALTVLKNVPNINKKEVRGVCDHCLTEQNICCDCDNVLKKFMDSLPSEYPQEETRQWLTKIRHGLPHESDQDVGTEKIRSIPRLKPSRLQIPRDDVKPSHSNVSHISKIPITKDEKAEKNSEREFSAPLFPEPPVLSDYAKETLLKMGKEMAHDATAFLRLYSDIEAKDRENYSKLASLRTTKVMPEGTAVRFRHSTDPIAFDDDAIAERLIQEMAKTEKQALSYAENYKKQHSDEEDIDVRERFKENIPYRSRYSDEDDFDRSRTQQYRGRYSDEEDFDRKRRIDKKAARAQQYRDRYDDEEDLDRKRRIDKKATSAQQYRDRYDDEEDFDRKRRIDKKAARAQQYRDRYDDEDFDRKGRTDKKAARAQQYRDRYDDEDFDRKGRIDGKASRTLKYRDRYDNEEDLDRKGRADKRTSRTQQYSDRYSDEEDLERKRHGERTLKDKKFGRYAGIKNIESKQPLVTQPSSKVTLKKDSESESTLKSRKGKSYTEDVESKHRLKELPSKPPLTKDIEPQTISRELLIQRRRFASKSGGLKKDFSFYFPKGKKIHPVKRHITSSVLFKQTRDKLEAKAEEKKEEERQSKLEAEKRKIERKNKIEEKAKSQKILPLEVDEDEDRKTIKQPKIKSYEDMMDKKDIKKVQVSEKDFKKTRDKNFEKFPANVDKAIKVVKSDQGRLGKDDNKRQKAADKLESKLDAPKKGSKLKKKLTKTMKSDQNDKENKPSKKVEPEPPPKKELKIEKIKVTKSLDDLVLQLIQVRKERNVVSIPEPHGQLVEKRSHRATSTERIHKHHKKSQVSMIDVVESDDNILECEKIDDEVSDIIIGTEICKRTSPRSDKKTAVFVKNIFTDKKVEITLPKKKEEANETEDSRKGIIRYALSDRSFIEKGWTVLPTERVVRKMNIYRMRPAKPEFDWFKRNKNKGFITYDTGEKFAEFEQKGCVRWFYKNGRIALDYYDAEEKNAQKRFIIYSSGEPDDLGQPHPYTVLGVFDYLGNGIVYDHTGKIRLKYNQTEGVLLDKSVAPESQWKWHTLNDPPNLQQIIVDTQMPYKDTEIANLGLELGDKPARENHEEMLSIEFENFIKEKSKKLNQTFKPFKIRMKALKINKHFSLKVLDQATIYLIYRDGSINIKLNIGMVLDPKEIIDTDVADLGIVYHSLEKFPAVTDSLARIQKAIQYTQTAEKARLERDRRIKIPVQIDSVDNLTAAASRPMRFPFRTVPSCSTSCITTSRK